MDLRLDTLMDKGDAAALTVTANDRLILLQPREATGFLYPM
jgi:hypothetical protein